MVEIALQLDWLPVESAPGTRYEYPDRTTKYLRKSYRGPAVYRWCLSHANKSSDYLVGETGCLFRRINEYRSHGGGHHDHICKAFDKCRGAGGKVWPETLSFEPFTVNGQGFSPNELFDPVLRAVLENLCIFLLKAQRFGVLNYTLEKQLAVKLEKMQREQPALFRELMAEIRSRK